MRKDFNWKFRISVEPNKFLFYLTQSNRFIILAHFNNNNYQFKQ